MSDDLTRWRATADLDARAGEPVGKALREAADEVERLRAAQPIGFQALHEAHHSIGQTVDRYRRGVITADEAMAAIHEQVGDETDRTAERDAEMETR